MGADDLGRVPDSKGDDELEAAFMEVYEPLVALVMELELQKACGGENPPRCPGTLLTDDEIRVARSLCAQAGYELVMIRRKLACGLNDPHIIQLNNRDERERLRLEERRHRILQVIEWDLVERARGIAPRIYSHYYS